MEELRVRGLRSLADTGSVRIAPITILLGENSSGKSTFLRSLPLLRQSVEVRTSEPLLWFGRLVDFGSFDESVSTFLETKAIQFELSLYFAPNSRSRTVAGSEHNPQVLGRVSFDIVGGPRTIGVEGTRIESYVSAVHLECCETTVDISFAGPTEFQRVVIDGEDVTEAAKATYAISKTISPVPTLYPKDLFDDLEDDREDEASQHDLPSRPTFEQLLHRHVKLHVHNRTKDDSIDELSARTRLGSPSSMLEWIKNIQAQHGIWRKHVASWDEKNDDFRLFKTLLWGVRLETLLDALADALRRDFLSISYITPLRAAAERYYRQQGLAVNELDAKGENFAPFLRSLSYYERDSLREWLSTALGIYVQPLESRGHVSLNLVDSDSGASVNLADTGFGYSQLLPIAVQLWLTQRRRSATFGKKARPVVVIEQPELHLHPRIQAKVADILAQIASSTDRQSRPYVVVETHSEALVNRLGRLIAQGKLDSSDVNVVLFNKKDFKDPSSVHTTGFDASGYLQDWPLGFFNAER